MLVHETLSEKGIQFFLGFLLIKQQKETHTDEGWTIHLEVFNFFPKGS